MSSHTTRLAAAWQESSRTDTDRWTAVPDRLLSVLTPREHQLVHALLSFRWFDDSPIVPRVKTLAAKMGGCSPRTVQRAAAKLQARGLIEILPRYRDDDGQCSNEYRPTAILLAMLPRATDQAAAGDVPQSQPPTTAAAYRRTDRNHQKRTSARELPGQPARSFSELIQTRRGSLSRLNR